MAGPLDGIDLGPPSPTKKQQPPAATPTTNTSGPLAGIDLSAPASTAPAASEVPWFSLTGNDKIGEFVAKMGDAATMGLAAKAQDALGFAQGPHGETVAQQVENAGKDIGPIASGVADVAGYGAGAGALGVGEGIGKLIGSGLARGVGENAVSRIGGRMVGSGIEGTGATIVGAAGHDENLSAGDLLKAAVLSTVTGALPGSKGETPTTPSTADLKAAADNLYAPLSNTRYSTDAVERVVNNVNIPQGLQAKMSSNLSDQIDRIKGIVAQGGKTTANDIADFRASLLGAAKNDTDMKIAGQYVSALENGVGPQMTANIGAANDASRVAKTSGDIDNWIDMTNKSPGKVPDAVDSAITDKPGFYKDVMPQLQDVANAKPGIVSQALGKVGGGLIGAGVEGGIDYITGKNPWAGAASGGLTGLLLGHAAGKIRASNLANQLAAARHFNATGVKLPPSAFSTGVPVLGPMGAYARQGVPGIGASGAFSQSFDPSQ